MILSSPVEAEDIAPDTPSLAGEACLVADYVHALFSEPREKDEEVRSPLRRRCAGRV